MLKTSIYLCMLMMFSGQFIHAKNVEPQKFLKKFDKNNDNRISFSEAPNKVQENFHRHDINRDGYIKGSELKSIPKKHPSRHHMLPENHFFHRPPPHHSGHRPPPPPRR